MNLLYNFEFSQYLLYISIMCHLLFDFLHRSSLYTMPILFTSAYIYLSIYLGTSTCISFILISFYTKNLIQCVNLYALFQSKNMYYGLFIKIFISEHSNPLAIFPPKKISVLSSSFLQQVQVDFFSC